MKWLLDAQQRRNQATPVELRIVAFADGSGPLPNQCHQNVNRWIAENPRCNRIRGWLITSRFIYDKHSVVEDNGSLYDITPRAYPSIPFLPYTGPDTEFCGIIAQWIGTGISN
jgi:hypothetical protein